MRHNIVRASLLCLALFAFGSITESADGQEAPRIITQPNAPGWITVSWEHTGQEVYYFSIQRQDSPYTDGSTFEIARSENRTDSVTDKNLKADTLYKYRVCAVYAYSRTCSDWVNARTLPPPVSSGGSSGGSTAPPPPARTPLATPELTAARDQDPKHVLLDWSGDPGWQTFGNIVNGLQYYTHPQINNVVLYSGIPGRPKSWITIYEELKRTDGSFVSLLSLTANVPVNTVFAYKICFSNIYGETKCSREINASGKPVAPTAPADVMVSQSRSPGNPRELDTRIRTFITARWRNTNIRGQFISLEREDRVQLDRLRLGLAWIELKQISALGDPYDPTELIVDVTLVDPELLTKRGNRYRVCSIVPALGAAGKVCSAAVSPLAVDSSSTSGTKEFPLPDLDALAARGLLLANQDPSATELRNQQVDDSARRGFDIGMGVAEGQTVPGPGKQRIHDSLPANQQDGYSAAVTFSLEKNRKKITDLAPRGAEVASQDPLAMQLRNLQPEGPRRLGFDIGMAAAEGQTADGPGKQKMHDSLYLEEQVGFATAVSFSLERNRNAKRAAVGAAISETDEGVAVIRNAEADPFYRLGFDIATGIFGDPAKGAQGNTATGPGSLGIRDSLSAAGRRGFNASVTLHLSRKYKP